MQLALQDRKARLLACVLKQSADDCSSSKDFGYILQLTRDNLVAGNDDEDGSWFT